ncbi:hypothetical protein VC83_03262 [Pseudogymnoascus destructans]|uniref:Uncharacterized protein n=1 Tax=Pseudogymnoascus destructans TaxID=655981 RepID=A0A177AE88_9PEZI|nr:uncharacterized protein VC83_03262 [Pseudogymnoascus destructans]OAF60387.1 hypothetical protein VC83_03262 [Pseudogymnoascus destructans]
MNRIQTFPENQADRMVLTPTHDPQLVFGCYQKPYFDPAELRPRITAENYEEPRQFSINDKLIIMQMEFCHPGGPIFEYGMRDSNSENVVFIYHVSDRQKFLELPYRYEKVCNTIMPQVAPPQPEPGTSGGSLAKRVLSRLHLRHREAKPPPPIMVLS